MDIDIMKERIGKSLEDLRGKGNYREIRHVEPLSATRLRYRGKECLNFCSNSYLSLHFHPAVIDGAVEATRRYGAGICSSRSVSGSIDLHERVEKKMAAYKGYKSALAFNTGYMANIGIISTLTGSGDVIFSDELNHSSIVDSVRLSRAKKVIYRHMDMDDLESKISNEKMRGEGFIVTETVFSMDGDMAPLDRINSLKEKYGVHVIIDEAHGTGVFGEQGVGVEEMYDLKGKMDVQMCTFGKSLGSVGAVALADPEITEYLVNRARTFMYTTALTPAALGAAEAALDIVSGDLSHKDALWNNIEYMRSRLLELGFDLRNSEGPIIPIVVGEDKKAVSMQQSLLERGIFLQAIRPPTVPSGTSRLRLSVISAFTKNEMDRALEALESAGRTEGIISF